MAVQVTERIAAVFQAPSIEGAQGLTDGRAGREFELFVNHVFERAGFVVQDVAQTREIPGIDAVLYHPSNMNKPYAYVQTKQIQRSVSIGEVIHLGGVIVPNPRVMKILVASNHASPEAETQAAQYDHYILMDVHHLIRYIKYIKGTRLPDDPNTVIHPQYVFDADKVSWKSPIETKVLTLANDKGGVGKTTSVINIAALLGELGQHVLVVDLDAQSNLSQRMPPEKRSTSQIENRTIVDYFLKKHSLGEVIRPTSHKNVSLIASCDDVKLTARGVDDWTPSILDFANGLHSPNVRPPFHVAPKFDWIILDTPTADEYKIRLALGASHFVLAPAIPSAFAASGLKVLFSTVDAMQSLMGMHVRFAGCFLTQCETITGRIESLLADTRDELRLRKTAILKTTIPRSQSIETAHLGRRSLFGRRTLSEVGRAYKRMVEEDLLPYVNSID